MQPSFDLREIVDKSGPGTRRGRPDAPACPPRALAQEHRRQQRQGAQGGAADGRVPAPVRARHGLLDRALRPGARLLRRQRPLRARAADLQRIHLRPVSNTSTRSRPTSAQRRDQAAATASARARAPSRPPTAPTRSSTTASSPPATATRRRGRPDHEAAARDRRGRGGALVVLRGRARRRRRRTTATTRCARSSTTPPT